MIKSVLLDLFGTVVAYGDTVLGTRLAWEGIYRVVRQLGARLSFEEFVAVWEEQFRTPLPRAQHVGGTVFVCKMLRLFRALDLPRDRGAAQVAVDGCLAGWDAHLYLPDDTVPALEALGIDHSIALVSNFDHPPYVRELLARLGLNEYLHHVVVSGDRNVDKPDPRIFVEALAATGCRPEESAFVGDNPRTDVEGSRAVGCHAILIDRRGKHTEYTQPMIRSLAELPPLLRRLASE